MRSHAPRERCCPAKAGLQLPPPEVRTLLAWKHTMRIELVCVNAVEPVTLTGTPVDLRAFHDEGRRRRHGSHAH